MRNTIVYIAVDFNKEAWLYSTKPIRDEYSKVWMAISSTKYIQIPYYLVEKLIGIQITWKDEPVKIKKDIK